MIRVILVAIVIAALTLSVLGLWFVADPGSIRRVVLNFRNDNQAPTTNEQIVVFSNGLYFDQKRRLGPPLSGHVKIGSFMDDLRAKPTVRLHPVGPMCDGCILLWVEGANRNAEPLIPAAWYDIDGSRQLVFWIRDLVHADIAHAEAPMRNELRSLRALQSTEFDSLGCFGSCGVYTLRFFGDKATLAWRNPGEPARDHVGTYSPLRLRAALIAAHVDKLESGYDSVGDDAWRARLAFRFLDRVFTVDAPDSMSWPSEMWAVVRAIRVEASRTAWSPALNDSEKRSLHVRDTR